MTNQAVFQLRACKSLPRTRFQACLLCVGDKKPVTLTEVIRTGGNTMKRIASLCLVVLWACISTAQTPKKPVFTSFDYPGSVDTEATAITPSGEIVGRYFTFDGTNFHEHGFLLTNGQFQPIDFPDSIDTDVTYINPRGEIVGVYDLAD